MFIGTLYTSFTKVIHTLFRLLKALYKVVQQILSWLTRATIIRINYTTIDENKILKHSYLHCFHKGMLTMNEIDTDVFCIYINMLFNRIMPFLLKYNCKINIGYIHETFLQLDYNFFLFQKDVLRNDMSVHQLIDDWMTLKSFYIGFHSIYFRITRLGMYVWSCDKMERKNKFNLFTSII